METHSPHRTATLRLSTWLLASASALSLSGAATAEPLQPFWVIPAVLADAGVRPQNQQLERLTLYRPAQPVPLNLVLFTPSTVEQDWPALRVSSLTQTGNFDPLGTTRFVTSDVSFQPAVPGKVRRIAEGLDFSGAVLAQAYTLDSAFLNGRFKFSTEVIDESDQLDPRDFRDPLLRETPRAIRPQDLTRRSRFTAKLIDSENLMLMVDGDFGQVSQRFASSLDELSDGQLLLPGSWSNFSSRLEFGQTNVTVGYQDYETRNEANKRQQLVLGFKKSELQVYRRQGTEFNLINGGQWLKRTSFSGITADLMVADVLPNAVMDTLDPVRHLLPTSVSGGFERGDVIRSEFTTGPRDKVSTANLSMTWNTRLGETTASFWERRVSTDLITPGSEDGLKLARSQDRYVDFSHSMRHGNWKFGAGLSLIQTNDSVLNNQFSDSETAPHVSIAYAPEKGAKVELRFGAADAQSQIVDDNLAARAKTKQLQLSVDVSDYVRETLDRPDAKLKLEYRYDFDKSTTVDANGVHEREGGHALLVTFSTPLN